MESDKNKDITKHIAEVLKGHSFPYKEGAWERFKDFEASKKRKVVLWPYYTGAAAVVLIAMSLFLIIGKNENNNQQVVKQEKISTIIDKQDQNTESVDKNELESNEKIVMLDKSQNLAIIDKLSVLHHEQLDLSEINLSSSSITYEMNTNEYKETQSIALIPPAVSNGISSTSIDKSTFLPYAETDSSNQIDVNITDAKKWDFSIELSPNIKDKDVNFGGGFAIAYNLTDKVSIGSGVSYMHLNAQRAPNKVDIPPEFSTLDGTNNKSLNTISTSLVGLDIPLNLKLNIGNAMYANAGVSMFRVLNESRYNNFEEHIVVTALANPTVSAAKENTGVEARALYSQEVNMNTPYEGKSFTGFFNFSVGYKLPLFPKMNLAVEPYFKIPIGSLSGQDMDLNNGGFKIKASF